MKDILDVLYKEKEPIKLTHIIMKAKKLEPKKSLDDSRVRPVNKTLRLIRCMPFSHVFLD